MECRPDFSSWLPDLLFEEEASAASAGSTRDMVGKTVELEQQMSQHLCKLQTDVSELQGLSSLVATLDKRTVQVENQLSTLVRSCAELSGKCIGLSEEMQVQLRNNKKDSRSKCMELELRFQRAFTADVKPLEHSVTWHGQQLKAIENTIQMVKNSIEAIRQYLFAEADIDHSAIQTLSEKVQQVFAAISKQSGADAEMRSELASLRERLGRRRDNAECPAKDLAQALEMLEEELPEIRTSSEKLEESEQQFRLHDTSPLLAISPNGTCPLLASTAPEVRKWAMSIEARLGSLESGTSPDSALAGFDVRLKTFLENKCSRLHRRLRDLEEKEALRCAAAAAQSEATEARWTILEGEQLKTLARSDDLHGAAMQSSQPHLQDLEEVKARLTALEAKGNPCESHKQVIESRLQKLEWTKDAADADIRSAIKQLWEKAVVGGNAESLEAPALDARSLDMSGVRNRIRASLEALSSQSTCSAIQNVAEVTTEIEIKKAEKQLKEVRHQAEEFSERLVSVRRQYVNSSDAAKTSRYFHTFMNSIGDGVEEEAEAFQSQLERLAGMNVTNLTDRLVSLETDVKAISDAVSLQSEQQKERCAELADNISGLGNTLAQMQGNMEALFPAAAGIDGADWHYIGT